MCTRKLFEIALFLLYWVGFAYLALIHIYYKSIVKPLKWDTNPAMQWPSLAVCLFILVIIYLVVRYLALILYAKCKISEERLVAKTKQKIRAIKESSKKSSMASINLTYENEKLTNQCNQDQNNNNNDDNNKVKRFVSLNNITPPIRGTIMKNGKSLDTVLDNENITEKIHSKSLEELIDAYKKPDNDNNVENKLQKYNKYATAPNEKLSTKHYKSAENLLDYNKIESFNYSPSVGNLAKRFENLFEVVDGAPNSWSSLREATTSPQPQKTTAQTLPRMPKKLKGPAPAPPNVNTSTMPRCHKQQSLITKPPLSKSKPVLLKNVLISNAKLPQQISNNSNFNV